MGERKHDGYPLLDEIEMVDVLFLIQVVESAVEFQQDDIPIFLLLVDILSEIRLLDEFVVSEDRYFRS